MRRNMKKQLIEIMDTICSAGIDIAAGAYEGEALLQILSECQDGSVAVGTAIEESEGEETQTVQRIEAFCELLYQIAQAAGEPARVRKLGKVARTKAIDIQNSIKNDIPDRLEVLFLPYMASMWDSLESIWRAADEDPDCDAYVVSVPYYDKLPDGSRGNLHDDWGKYPADVPILYYREYDIMNRRPDMIYIHNPYDDNNAVTSVLPEFYASNLKDYTDMLVYVPYFLSIEDKIERHFCILPGTIYADKVIVESEAVREIYIEEYRKVLKHNKISISEAEIREKFVALGSPKLDKVMESRREDYALPRDWETLKGGRKAILYNTHLNGLMQQGELFLRKIRSVLRIFEKREDIVLWWRPHPLSEVTVQAMNPAYLKEYEAIVAEYRRAGFGIFDDTAELHRAIVWTDAYYGDWSSLVTMYQATGKPIMIQNMQIIEEELPCEEAEDLENESFNALG